MSFKQSSPPPESSYSIDDVLDGKFFRPHPYELKDKTKIHRTIVQTGPTTFLDEIEPSTKKRNTRLYNSFNKGKKTNMDTDDETVYYDSS